VVSQSPDEDSLSSDAHNNAAPKHNNRTSQSPDEDSLSSDLYFSGQSDASQIPGVSIP